MSNPHLDELAALRGIDLLDETGAAELRAAMETDAELCALVLDYENVAAGLATTVTQVAPPTRLKQEILKQLPARRSNIIATSFLTWMPYAVAACLMLLGILQAQKIVALKERLAVAQGDVNRLEHTNTLLGLRVALLEAKDASYVNAKVIVAWDPLLHKGVISIQNLPPPQAGHDYQLWVLDPSVKTPISAGLVSNATGSQPFVAGEASSSSSPGFAISLEPAGGRPTPTGSILFAVGSSQ